MVGFGPVGQGVAARARDLGAVVTVVDLDPVRLVQAQHDGCRVAEMAAALRTASVIVTATGFDGVLGERQLSQIADGAILVNVGHSDREIDVDWLDRHPSTPVRRHLERYELDGRRVYLLNRGSLVNLAAGLGIGAPQLFDPFAAIMLLGLDAILSGRPQICRTVCSATRVRWRNAWRGRSPPAPPDRCSGLAGWRRGALLSEPARLAAHGLLDALVRRDLPTRRASRRSNAATRRFPSGSTSGQTRSRRPAGCSPRGCRYDVSPDRSRRPEWGERACTAARGAARTMSPVPASPGITASAPDL